MLDNPYLQKAGDKMKKIAFILCALILLSGCTKTKVKDLRESEFAAIYTSSAEEKSKLIFTDEEGREVYSRDFDKQGMFNIIRTGNTLKLPVRFSNEMVSFDLKEKDTSTGKTLDFPFHYTNLGDREFTIYNSDKKGDIDYLTYEIRTKDKVIQKRIKGFPQCYTIHNNRAYVQTDNVPANRQYINVIDLDNLEIIETIDSYCEVAGDIKVIDDFLYLADMTDSRVVGISLSNHEERRIKNLNSNMPQFIMPYGSSIIILHQDYITMLENNLRVEKTQELKNKVLKVKIYGDKLFLLSQDEGGMIIRVDAESLAVEKTIRLGGRGELLVQDFEVLRGEGRE